MLKFCHPSKWLFLVITSVFIILARPIYTWHLNQIELIWLYFWRAAYSFYYSSTTWNVFPMFKKEKRSLPIDCINIFMSGGQSLFSGIPLPISLPLPDQECKSWEGASFAHQLYEVKALGSFCFHLPHPLYHQDLNSLLPECLFLKYQLFCDLTHMQKKKKSPPSNYIIQQVLVYLQNLETITTLFLERFH